MRPERQPDTHRPCDADGCRSDIGANAITDAHADAHAESNQCSADAQRHSKCNKHRYAVSYAKRHMDDDTNTNAITHSRCWHNCAYANSSLKAAGSLWKIRYCAGGVSLRT